MLHVTVKLMANYLVSVHAVSIPYVFSRLPPSRITILRWTVLQYFSAAVLQRDRFRKQEAQLLLRDRATFISFDKKYFRM